MRPRRDPKRKPPSEQALREALRKDLPQESEATGRAPSRPKPRKKRKRPSARPAERPPRPPADEDPDVEDEAVGADDAGPDADEPTDGPSGDAPDDSASRRDPRVEDLEDKVRQLTDALAGMSSEKSELEGVAEKFRGMEDRMKSLLQLSEVLSVRYNPFLSNEEGDVFDGSRHDPSSLLPRSRPGREPHRPSEVLRPAPAPVEERFRGEVVRVESDEPTAVEDGPDAAQAPPEEQTAEEELDAELEAALAPFAEEQAELEELDAEDLEADEADGEEHREEEPEADLDVPEQPDEGADEPDRQAVEPEPTPVAAAAESAEAEPEPAPEPTPHPHSEPRAPAAPQPPPARPQAPRPQQPHRPVPPALPARPAATAQPGPSPPYHAPGRSRESYLALCWFERLAREGDPAEIHLFVDHYAGLGWIPPEHHGWMAYLAESVAPRRPELTWADVEAPSHELARLHRRNLRFLDRLFRCGLGVDDPLRWDDEAQWWMEGE